MVICAVVLDLGCPVEGVNDSKKVPSKERHRIAKEIKANHRHSLAIIPVDKIESLNILGATMLGMHVCLEAFEDILKEGDTIIAIDGNIKIPEIPEDRQISIIKGDAKSASIAAASIVAKVERDLIMEREAIRFPGYGFEEHKGYGSPRHIEAIRSLGLCEIHRQSFCKKFTTSGLVSESISSS